MQKTFRIDEQYVTENMRYQREKRNTVLLYLLSKHFKDVENAYDATKLVLDLAHDTHRKLADIHYTKLDLAYKSLYAKCHDSLQSTFTYETADKLNMVMSEKVFVQTYVHDYAEHGVHTDDVIDFMAKEFSDEIYELYGAKTPIERAYVTYCIDHSTESIWLKSIGYNLLKEDIQNTLKTAVPKSKFRSAFMLYESVVGLIHQDFYNTIGRSDEIAKLAYDSYCSHIQNNVLDQVGYYRLSSDDRHKIDSHLKSVGLTTSRSMAESAREIKRLSVQCPIATAKEMNLHTDAEKALLVLRILNNTKVEPSCIKLIDPPELNKEQILRIYIVGGGNPTPTYQAMKIYEMAAKWDSTFKNVSISNPISDDVILAAFQYLIEKECPELKKILNIQV